MPSPGGSRPRSSEGGSSRVAASIRSASSRRGGGIAPVSRRHGRCFSYLIGRLTDLVIWSYSIFVEISAFFGCLARYGCNVSATSAAPRYLLYVRFGAYRTCDLARDGYAATAVKVFCFTACPRLRPCCGNVVLPHYHGNPEIFLKKGVDILCTV